MQRSGLAVVSKFVPCRGILICLFSLVARYEIGDHFEFRSLGSEHDKKRPG